MAQKLGLRCHHSSFKSVNVANGKSVPIIGTTDLALQLGPTILNITAQVLPSFLPHIDLIVGQSAMKQYSVELKHNPIQCVIQPTTGGINSAVTLDNATGAYKSFMHLTSITFALLLKIIVACPIRFFAKLP